MGPAAHHALFIGTSRIAKTWLASAVVHEAGQLLLKLARVDILLLDDFAMAPVKDYELRDSLEICDR